MVSSVPKQGSSLLPEAWISPGALWGAYVLEPLPACAGFRGGLTVGAFA